MTVWTDGPVTVLVGDALAVLREMPAESVHCVVTSPPYWGLRDYGAPGQLGLEPTPEEYVCRMVEVFGEVRRVLRPDGTLWLNLGDSYASNGGKGDTTSGFNERWSAGAWSRQGKQAGIHDQRPMRGRGDLKPKDLVMMPARLALALQADGWWLRSDIIWSKPNPMPESVADRPTTAHEHVFLLARSERYFYDAEAVRETSTGTNHHDLTGNGYAPPGQQPSNGNRRSKMPDGWDTGAGGHGSFHRNGREAGAPSEIRAGRNLRSVWTIATQPFSGEYETVRWERVEAGAVGGGIQRRESPDCPVHGGRSGLAPTAPDGGHGAGSSSRNGRTVDPGRGLGGEPVPTGPSHGPGAPAGSSDSPRPSCSSTATAHSTESHRSASPSAEGDTPAAEQPARTPYMEMSGASPESDGYSGPDSSRTLGRTDDTSCTCEFYRKVTEKGSHFATFPEELARRCIAAGTSERGCCPECGAPWRRVVESYAITTGTGRNHIAGGDKVAGNGWEGVPRAWLDTHTTGWQPTCAHDYEPVACTVLDPFAGSGTTLAVARRMGRRAVGVELQADYLPLIRKRVEEAAMPLLETAMD